ncbi:MAG: putative ABC transport system permease protein [Cyclobacteriaceae bacterium]
MIGVIDNVLMGSPYEAVKPMFMVHDPDWINYVTLRLKKTNNLSASLNSVESIFNKHNPAYPFEYKFVDVEFGKKFSTINLTQKLATIFSFLAIFITGLGLFGLASYMAEQRIKEIGIRKVLGASVLSLVVLISKEFTKLVILSFVLAAPASWFLLNTYLERYPIRTDLEWWIFPLAGVIALIFALGIVSNQARKAALTNPANSLRNE